MGLTLHAQQGYRMNVLTSVRIPAGIDDLRIRQRLLDEYSIDIWGGFGKLKGQIWRIGLMGFSSTEENVLLVLFALGKLLAEEGYPVEPEAGVTAAIRTLRKEYCTVTQS
jgi:alanine-glyoxylate transaminase/serine-glyoxylate transaminase/serine-pyruvate transaminase